MLATCLITTVNKIASFAKCLRNDKKGVAAVEFALISPILLMLLIGTLELGTAYTIDRRVSLIASSVADLVSRDAKLGNPTLNARDRAEMYLMSDKIARALITPYDFAPIKIHITKVQSDINDATKTTVSWAISYSGNDPDMDTTQPPYNAGDKYPMPGGLMAPGTTIYAVTATYDFTPLVFSNAAAKSITGVDGLTTGAYQMTDTFYMSPRF